MNLGTVLIADDHAFVLHFIRELLLKQFLIDDIVSLTNLPAIKKAIERQEFDLYILNLDFRGENSFPLIDKIRKQQKNARIIVNIDHWASWHINTLLRQGLNGIVLKETCDRYLPEAVNAVVSGNTYLCPNCKSLKQNYALDVRKNREMRKEITDKELEILSNIANGYTTIQIADRCNISVNTVEFHRKNLILKLEAENAPHLVAKAVYYRLVELENR